MAKARRDLPVIAFKSQRAWDAWLTSQPAKDRKAKSFFETLDSKNRYAILHRIHNAKKAETRIARIEKFVAMRIEGKNPLSAEIQALKGRRRRGGRSSTHRRHCRARRYGPGTWVTPFGDMGNTSAARGRV
jgi:Bacteriocin-protection, YdeI or OmpD-Associated